MKKSKKKIPTQEEIDAEIKWLTDNKPRLRKLTAFGDNNHDAIDAQIEVLKNKLTDDQIDARSQFEDDDTYGDDSLWTTNVRDCANATAQWLTGDEPEKPSSGWSSLLPPAKKESSL